MTDREKMIETDAAPEPECSTVPCRECGVLTYSCGDDCDRHDGSPRCELHTGEWVCGPNCWEKATQSFDAPEPEEPAGGEGEDAAVEAAFSATMRELELDPSRTGRGICDVARVAARHACRSAIRSRDAKIEKVKQALAWWRTEACRIADERDAALGEVERLRAYLTDLKGRVEPALWTVIEAALRPEREVERG